ncbi:hypothetical protein GCM10007962_32470 [Yeosuana aromativorans]|uniref:Lipoprotein n=1 Tax=Yeosuana aromativorans TaxID=288019 RepID=A0A8J3BP21_9FLAO|nr:hypothetical protein [Yeosuana aromativorans]GGK35559.1 hypothetical protein GCM10007962_32470 [Yeosuana aromativorans]
MRNFTYILLFFIIVSCKTTKTLADYGILDKRNVCSNDDYKNGNLIFKIKDYELVFDFNNFVKELESYEKETSTDFSKTLRNNYFNQKNKILLSKIDQEYFINGTESVKFDNSFGINISLDNLYKSGKFYLKNTKNIQCAEYEHWQPHEQGTIDSKWIIDRKVVNEIIFGFVN